MACITCILHLIYCLYCTSKTKSTLWSGFQSIFLSDRKRGFQSFWCLMFGVCFHNWVGMKCWMFIFTSAVKTFQIALKMLEGRERMDDISLESDVSVFLLLLLFVNGGIIRGRELMLRECGWIFLPSYIQNVFIKWMQKCPSQAITFSWPVYGRLNHPEA